VETVHSLLDPSKTNVERRKSGAKTKSFWTLWVTSEEELMEEVAVASAISQTFLMVPHTTIVTKPS
jgi:hypothetical protein